MAWLKTYRDKRRVKRDAKLAHNKGLAEGFEMASHQHIGGLSKLKERVDVMTSDFVSQERKLNANYRARLETIEQEHKQKCEVCKKGIEAERAKLIDLQQQLHARISGFQQIERRLFTFLSLVEGSFEAIVRNSSRLTDSLSQLSVITKEADSFLEETKNLLEMQP